MVNELEPSVHLVLRIPVTTRIAGKVVDTVSAHNETFKAFNVALFAKFGASIVAKSLDNLNRQIGNGVETRLILVSQVRRKALRSFTAHQARLASIYPKHLPSEYESFAPSYYKDVEQVPSTWFRLSCPFKPCDLQGLRLASNKRSLLEVIRECRTTAMLVEEIRSRECPVAHDILR
jgi:hypothetical protein